MSYERGTRCSAMYVVGGLFVYNSSRAVRGETCNKMLLCKYGRGVEFKYNMFAFLNILAKLKIMKILCIFVLMVLMMFAAYDMHSAEDQPPAAMLGIQMTPPPARVQRINGITAYQGVYVREVFAGTVAEVMGVMAGDVILNMNGREIKKMTDIRQVVDACAVGDRVYVMSMRNGKKYTAEGVFGRWIDTVEKSKLNVDAEKEYRKRSARVHREESAVKKTELDADAEERYRRSTSWIHPEESSPNMVRLYHELTALAGPYAHVPTVGIIYSQVKPKGSIFEISINEGIIIVRRCSQERVKSASKNSTSTNILEITYENNSALDILSALSKYNKK